MKVKILLEKAGRSIQATLSDEFGPVVSVRKPTKIEAQTWALHKASELLDGPFEVEVADLVGP